MPKKFLFLILSLLILASLTVARSQKLTPLILPEATTVAEVSKWETYMYPGEEFSVMLPEMPVVSVASYQMFGPSRRFSVRTFAAYSEGIVYVVASLYDMRGGETDDDFINGYKDAYMPSATFSAATQVKPDKKSGRPYLIRIEKGRMIEGMAYLYRRPSRVYLVQAVGAPPDDPAIKQFFDSFKFSDKPAGTEIKDLAPIRWRQPPANSGPEKAEAAPKDVQASSDRNKSPVAQSTPVNTGDAPPVFRSKEVTHRAVFVSMPQPGFTEEARKNNTTGVVRLQGVLLSSGEVRNIRVVHPLPDGLTEKAINAFRKMKFIPALKDGRRVSQYVTIEYNFNIY